MTVNNFIFSTAHHLKMGVVRSFNLYPIVEMAANLHSNTRIYDRRKEPDILLSTSLKLTSYRL